MTTPCAVHARWLLALLALACSACLVSPSERAGIAAHDQPLVDAQGGALLTDLPTRDPLFGLHGRLIFWHGTDRVQEIIAQFGIPGRYIEYAVQGPRVEGTLRQRDCGSIRLFRVARFTQEVVPGPVNHSFSYRVTLKNGQQYAMPRYGICPLADRWNEPDFTPLWLEVRARLRHEPFRFLATDPRYAAGTRPVAVSPLDIIQLDID